MERNDFGYVDAIVEHSAGFAAAATGNLAAQVEHCPDWKVADLVWHLTEVQWFWATIAEERLAEPPDEARRPPRPADDKLIDTFRAGADNLADVLRRTPYRDSAWTWSHQKDVGFIARHQVQEAAVHHFDAANAAGQSIEIRPTVAADAVDEFLTFSLSTEDGGFDPNIPPLDGAFALRSSDIDASWTLTDGKAPSTIATINGIADGVPTITAPAADLLLWLYRRTSIDISQVPTDLFARFVALTFTD